MRRSGGSDSGSTKIAVGGIGEAEAGRHPERQPRVEAPRMPPSAGPSTKPMPKAAPISPNALRALLRRRHVGDVGVGRGEARRRDARDDAADEQPRSGWAPAPSGCSRGRGRSSRSAAPGAGRTVGQRAEHRREEELHQRPGGAEQAEDLGGPRPCRRPIMLSTSFGSTGMTMPSAMTSSSTMTKMKAIAALRGCGLGLLSAWPPVVPARRRE